jgi:hypothetical protein
MNGFVNIEPSTTDGPKSIGIGSVSTEDPRVGGSIPLLATNFFRQLRELIGVPIGDHRA